MLLMVWLFLIPDVLAVVLMALVALLVVLVPLVLMVDLHLVVRAQKEMVVQDFRY